MSSSKGADNNRIDELRIGTTYGDVMPSAPVVPLLPPAAVLAPGSLLVAFGAGRARRVEA
jgi:hypothetical protein